MNQGPGLGVKINWLLSTCFVYILSGTYAGYPVNFGLLTHILSTNTITQLRWLTKFFFPLRIGKMKMVAKEPLCTLGMHILSKFTILY